MPDLPCWGGGVNPTSMAQNDTHIALIILTTQMWGGGIIGGKNFLGPKFVFLCLRRQHPFLHKTKGPTRNPISPTPPPPLLLRRASMSPPPPRRAIFRSPRESMSDSLGACRHSAHMTGRNWVFLLQLAIFLPYSLRSANQKQQCWGHQSPLMGPASSEARLLCSPVCINAFEQGQGHQRVDGGQSGLWCRCGAMMQ